MTTRPLPMPWQTFPHEADIGVRGTGATLEEASAGAALALTAAICAPATVAPHKEVVIDLTPQDVALLLDWLSEENKSVLFLRGCLYPPVLGTFLCMQLPIAMFKPRAIQSKGRAIKAAVIGRQDN